MAEVFTCRNCDLPVIPDEKGIYRVIFTHQGTLETECVRENPDDPITRAAPKERCVYRTGQGDTCMGNIKPEDQSARLWACGRHMRQEAAERERMDAMRRMREVEAEDKIKREWEITTYEAAKVRLEAAGHAGLLGTYAVRTGWDKSRINRTIPIDLIELVEALLGKEDTSADQNNEAGRFVGGGDLPV
jgi:hypothetical protein